MCCGKLPMTLDDMSRRRVRWRAAGDAQVLHLSESSGASTHNHGTAVTHHTPANNIKAVAIIPYTKAQSQRLSLT